MSRSFRPWKFDGPLLLPTTVADFIDESQSWPQPDPVLLRQAVEPLDGRMQQLGVGRKGDGLRLYRSIHRDPLEVLAA